MRSLLPGYVVWDQHERQISGHHGVKAQELQNIGERQSAERLTVRTTHLGSHKKCKPRKTMPGATSY